MQGLSYIATRTRTRTRTRTTSLQPEPSDPAETAIDELREELRHHDNLAFLQFLVTLGMIVTAWVLR